MDDVVPIIFTYISDGLTYKSFIFTCKMFAKCASDDAVDRFSNHHATLLTYGSTDKEKLQFLPPKYFPDNWKSSNLVILNRYITEDFIAANLDYPWDIEGLATHNRYIDIEKVIDIIDDDRDLSELCVDGFISFDYFAKRHNSNDWKAVSVLAPLDFIESHPEYLWRWRDISYRTDLTRDFINRNIHLINIKKVAYHFPIWKYPEMSPNWWHNTVLCQHISLSECLDTTFIRTYADYLDWTLVSSNETFDISDIVNNFDLPWTDAVYSRNIPSECILSFIDAISFDFSAPYAARHVTQIKHVDEFLIKYKHAHPKIPSYLACNIYLTKKVMRNHPDINWQRHTPAPMRASFISQDIPFTDLNITLRTWNRSYVTLDYLLANPQSPLIMWCDATLNEHISIKEIIKHLDLPWDMKVIFNRDDMTWRISLHLTKSSGATHLDQ